MSDPLFRTVDSVQVAVPDIDEALGFYRDELGHELVWRTEKGAGLRLPETDAELVLQAERPFPETDIKVASADEAAERFVKAGGKVLNGPFDIPIGRCVVVQDPWGNVLVLLDGTKGSFVTDEEGNVVGVD